MSARRTHRPAIICAIVFALLASAMSGAADARTGKETREIRLALEQERYYSGNDGSRGAGDVAAQAQERYYSSYGQPEPLAVAQSPAPSDDTPWLPIALSVAAALAIAVAGTTQVRRLRIRRATRVTT